MLSSDFIVMGVAEIETGNHRYICDALLTSLHNPRRSLVESVTLTSNNMRQTDFILVGPTRDVLPLAEDPACQAAWVHNHRRTLAHAADCHTLQLRVECPTNLEAKVDLPGGVYDCSYSSNGDYTPSPCTPSRAGDFFIAGKRVDTPCPGRRKLNVQPSPSILQEVKLQLRERNERTSNDSVMSPVIS
jgi:hypothetical protein